jgi:hypothetical protein
MGFGGIKIKVDEMAANSIDEIQCTDFGEERRTREWHHEPPCVTFSQKPLILIFLELIRFGLLPNANYPSN